MNDAASTRSFCVLITRPEEDAKPLAADLAARGINSVVAPILDIRILDGPQIALGDVQAVLATSANGVRALSRRTPARDCRLFAVGDATARAARLAGFAQVESAAGDVEALAALVRQRLNPCDGTVLHVAGSEVAGDLATALTASGFSYRRAVLYQAHKAEHLSAAAKRALAEGLLDGVLFYSPRTGRSFVSHVLDAGLVGACRPLSAFCLSEAVARAVAELPWQKTIIVERPDQEAMIVALTTAANRSDRG